MAEVKELPIKVTVCCKESEIKEVIESAKNQNGKVTGVVIEYNSIRIWENEKEKK